MCSVSLKQEIEVLLFNTFSHVYNYVIAILKNLKGRRNYIKIYFEYCLSFWPNFTKKTSLHI